MLVTGRLGGHTEAKVVESHKGMRRVELVHKVPELGGRPRVPVEEHESFLRGEVATVDVVDLAVRRVVEGAGGPCAREDGGGGRWVSGGGCGEEHKGKQGSHSVQKGMLAMCRHHMKQVVTQADLCRFR